MMQMHNLGMHGERKLGKTIVSYQLPRVFRNTRYQLEFQSIVASVLFGISTEVATVLHYYFSYYSGTTSTSSSSRLLVLLLATTSTTRVATTTTSSY